MSKDLKDINKTLATKKILVTGGAGFIGSHLVDFLLDKEFEVRVLDNFSTGFRHNLEHAGKFKSFELIEGDIRNLETCRKACDNVDLVFHQAALGSVPRSIADPITSNEVNVTGFLNMLMAAKEGGVKRFIYAASSSTYGDHPGLPKVEDKIGRPLSPYAVTKYVNELYADVFAKTYGLEVIGLRYFNVFGPRQNPEGAYAAVIPKFIHSLLAGKEPIINGDGNHARDFTYVQNVILANWKAAIVEEPKALNQVYNVGCNESTSINELFQAIKANLTLFDPAIEKLEAIHGPERPGDVKKSLASIEKADKLLGYLPSVLFSQGITTTVEWFWQSVNTTIND